MNRLFFRIGFLAIFSSLILTSAHAGTSKHRAPAAKQVKKSVVKTKVGTRVVAKSKVAARKRVVR